MKPFYYLSDFPERKNAGQNFVAECPKCGKKHLSISKKTGAFHCFYAGCDFNGKLKDFWEERPYSDSSFTGNTGGNYAGTNKTARYSCKGNDAASSNNSTSSGKSTSEVPMIPEDYKRLSPEVFSKIKLLTNDPETNDQDQLAARRYLADQGISLEKAIEARIGCLTHRCYGKDDEKKSTGTLYHCIAYVNYVNGQPVNVKYRSCDPSNIKIASNENVTGTENPVCYTKFWSQDSPTTPCAPYNIDCINPLRVSEDHIPRLIVTEGEKDVLTLQEAGYPCVISVPNGAASDLAKTFEAFEPWLDQVRDIVICGDRDLPGRTLIKHLTDYFGARCLLTILPGDCKDISDVLATYGINVVREIIESAEPQHTSDIITVSERSNEIMDALHGEYDHGYNVGYGPLTDHIFHPTDQGGLIITTGKPNSGKTDFLNDLTCRLMAKTGRYVCYLSFEVPDKNKHIAHLIQLMLGKVNTANYTREQLQPIVSFLNTHMVHLDLHEVSPTPTNIIARGRQGTTDSSTEISDYRPVPLHGNGNGTLQHRNASHKSHADANAGMGTQQQHLGNHRGTSAQPEKAERNKRTGRHRYVHHFGKCQLGQSRRFHLFHLPNQRTGSKLHPTRYAESSRSRLVPDRKRTVCSSDLRTL